MTRRLFGAASLAAFIGGIGCDSGPRLIPVSGIVLIDGQPLQYGTVQVVPDGHRAAFGKIGSDGRFTLTTNEAGDGVVAGTHKVAVIASVAKGPSVTWHAPKKYIDSSSSGLTLVVDKPTKEAKLELKWEGGKPFTENGAGKE